MAHSPAAAVKRFIQTVQLTDGPRRAAEWLVTICIESGWESYTSDAREWAERTEEGFLRLLRREMAAFNASGRPAPFTFNSSSDYMLQGAAFIEPRDSPGVRVAKEHRAHLLAYETALRSLTPGQFEAACGGLLRLLGVKSFVTLPSRDEGIDFYGLWPLGENLFPDQIFPTFARQMCMWIAGQAKRYSSGAVTTPDIRDIIGAVEIARADALRSDTRLRHEFRPRLSDPVALLFITTGTIGAPGWELLKRTGVIGIDGSMTASFLAARGVAFIDGNFSETAFRQWVNHCQES